MNKQWLQNCVPPFALRRGHGRTARSWRSNGTSGRHVSSSLLPKQPFEKRWQKRALLIPPSVCGQVRSRSTEPSPGGPALSRHGQASRRRASRHHRS
eukprot:scaffold36298_cov84-Phaeocystis_antarctica.AAC.1